MKLVLDQEQLYFSGASNRIDIPPVKIPFEDLSQKRKNAVEWKYRVNNSSLKKLEGNNIVANLSDLKKGSLKIELVSRNKSTGEETSYETEELSVVHYFGFGMRLEEAYPRTISELKSEVEALKERIQKLEEEGDFV